MSIDFRLRDSSQAGTDAVLVLLPSLPDEPGVRAKAVFVSPLAFDFLEPCIAQHWGAYGSPVLHRACSIPAQAWQEIIPALSALRSELLQANAGQGMSGLSFAIPDLRYASEQNFSHIQQGLAKLITELLAWLALHLPGCGHITIVRL